VTQAGVLLDRDGTIIVDHGYVGSVDRVEFIDGSIDAIATLNAAGIPVAVVTNQAGVARGLYGIEDVQQVHKHMIAELARHGAHVDLWLFCPYHPDGSVEAFARSSADRKPGPGMALAAASFPDLAAAVGHILTEVQAGAPQKPADRAKFPAHRFEQAEEFGGAYVAELARAFATVDLTEIRRAAEVLTAAYRRDAVVFSCGNGGSASIANHLQCDHVKGVRTGTDLTPRVVSLSTNVELLTAIANDLSYDSVFEYQLQSQARPGDVLIAVSSSGRSPNIVRALEWARAHGMQTIALTGFDGGTARRTAAVGVHVDSGNYGVIEDAHQSCMHLLAQYVRQSRMSADAVAATTF
jgi:D-sedoheptulose 7-phosphate isomerase/D-glycero-D-manno-heptose 1,7-bisphosphate phosphatase